MRRIVSRPLAALIDWFFWRGDARAAAAMRMAYAGCLLFLLWDLYPVRDLLLGHGGYYGTLDERFVRYGLLDVLFHADSPLALRIWFGAAGTLGLLVLTGLFTRLTVPASVLFLLCLHQRNPYMLFGADLVLFNIGLWLVFLRSGHAWSLDAWLRHRRGRPRSTVVPLWPLRVIQFQVALVYLRTAMAKLATEPWLDGSAVYYALHAMGNDVFPWILEQRLLLTLLTYLALTIEFGFAFLVFWRPTRWLAIVSAGLLHLGIDVLMAIRFFGPVMYAALASFVLPEEWGRLEAALRRTVGTTKADTSATAAARAKG